MKNKIFYIIFIAIWLILIVLNLIIPKQTFLEKENRYVAKFPSFTYDDFVNGKYSENLGTYINDNFIFRNFFLKLNSFVQEYTGKTEINGIYIGKDGYLFEKFKYTEKEKNNLEKAGAIINSFASKTNIPTYFLLIPNSIYINQNYLPDNVDAYNQKEIIENIYNICNNTINIDTTDILLENKELDLYFKTDHHMTSLGAYFVYQQFCKTANINYVTLDKFNEEVVSTEFLGTFDSKAQRCNQETERIIVYKNYINQNVEANYDGKIYNSIFNEDYLNKKDKYSYFLNGNNAKVVVQTQINNGKRLLVIKDSYAHILAQFLCQNYEEIHFIDPRYYNLPLSNYVNENHITEALFLYNVSNLINDTGIRLVK